jgi:transposase, IS6 family
MTPGNQRIPVRARPWVITVDDAVRPGLGFPSFLTATQTIAGYEVMAMIRKGQVVNAPANDMAAQRDFIATLFAEAA